MKDLILTVVSTNKGWVVRQVLKWVAVGSASLTTYLVSKGYDPTGIESLIAGLAAVAAGGTELVLSKIASKIATEDKPATTEVPK